MNTYPRGKSLGLFIFYLQKKRCCHRIRIQWNCIYLLVKIFNISPLFSENVKKRCLGQVLYSLFPRLIC